MFPKDYDIIDNIKILKSGNIIIDTDTSTDIWDGDSYILLETLETQNYLIVLNKTILLQLSELGDVYIYNESSQKYKQKIPMISDKEFIINVLSLNDTEFIIVRTNKSKYHKMEKMGDR